MEVAGGAAARGSWEHMWCWPEAEVQQSEVAGSVSTEQLLNGEKVQQLEVAEESDYSDNKVQCMVCEHGQQRAQAVSPSVFTPYNVPGESLVHRGATQRNYAPQHLHA